MMKVTPFFVVVFDREAIIYMGKQSISAKEVKKRLLNKEKIGKELTCESNVGQSSQCFFAKEKV